MQERSLCIHTVYWENPIALEKIIINESSSNTKANYEIIYAILYENSFIFPATKLCNECKHTEKNQIKQTQTEGDYS